MNNKAILGQIIFVIVVLGILLVVGYYTSKDYREYKSFCKERPTYCYCSLGNCEFKTSWSSFNGFSNETKELCDLAIKLEDKEMIFKVGCEE